MARRDSEAGGLSQEHLVGSAWNAWKEAMSGIGVVIPPWQEWQEEDQEAWASCVQYLQGLIEDAEEVRWQTLAANAWLRFELAKGNTPPEWDTLPLAIRLAWEAVVRHLANLLGGYSPGEDGPLDVHEQAWGKWVMDKWNLSQLPESQQRAIREQGEGVE